MLELATQCHARGAWSSGTTDGVIDGLIALAPSDEDAALCALVALRPALYWVARQVRGPRTYNEDAVAEIVAIAWDVLCDAAPVHGSRSRHVVLTTRTRARTAWRKRLDPRLREEPLDEEWDAPEPGSDPAERMESILERAVRRGDLALDDAQLIALTRVAGVPILELATGFGTSPKALFKRRDRAEAVLREFISSGRDSR
jgi:DNA-directed RNA polymerase specialized sigma24 family protein